MISVQCSVCRVWCSVCTVFPCFPGLAVSSMLHSLHTARHQCTDCTVHLHTATMLQPLYRLHSTSTHCHRAPTTAHTAHYICTLPQCFLLAAHCATHFTAHRTAHNIEHCTLQGSGHIIVDNTSLYCTHHYRPYCTAQVSVPCNAHSIVHFWVYFRLAKIDL